MDRDDDGETSYKYNTFVDDVAFESTSLRALPTAAGRNVATPCMYMYVCMYYVDLSIYAKLCIQRNFDISRPTGDTQSLVLNMFEHI